MAKNHWVSNRFENLTKGLSKKIAPFSFILPSFSPKSLQSLQRPNLFAGRKKKSMDQAKFEPMAILSFTTVTWCPNWLSHCACWKFVLIQWLEVRQNGCFSSVVDFTKSPYPRWSRILLSKTQKDLVHATNASVRPSFYKKNSNGVVCEYIAFACIAYYTHAHKV